MSRRAFTLIELLVVIAVIALLISLLLPGLGRARDAGRQVVCQAHMRGIVTGLAAYEGANKGWLPGPNTSGARLHAGLPYTPGQETPSQDWDYLSPIIGSSMGFSTDQLGKFEQICMTKLRCPSNRLRYIKRYQGPPLQIELKGEQPFTLSYMTPAYFQHYPTGVTQVGGRPVEWLPSGEAVQLSRGYVPRIDAVGPFPHRKIFSFEGARYYDASIKGFDYSTVTNGSGLSGSPQGNFLSRGSAFLGSGEYYLRESSRPGGRPSAILKQISLRHDERMNAGMFDGHVEALDNVASANPSYYAPTRSKLQFPWQSWYFYIGPTDSPYRQMNAEIE